ncbi:SprT-like domain-containing protein [uncultured Muribaculum sp.]|uniref:SprT-like domain-containing protein n=1 Tax=uncultured Muribaculum sp. TaxID=1918613 RepID=UPI0025F31591|nr:SprT-like domain-containing protein [uncultured Muribaculum sp.]
MTITLPLLADRFNRFNALIFGERLPRIPLRISNAATRAGSFSHRTLRSARGEVVHRRAISISRAFDLDPDALEDVVIHEMIHYWIDLYGPKEQPHGPAFRAMMAEINRTHHRHITVTVAATPKSASKIHIVCVAILSDGRTGIVLPARSRLMQMYRDIPRLFNTSGCRWYATTHPYFSRFPKAIRPKLYLPEPVALDSAISDAREIDLSSGKVRYLTKSLS